MDQRDRETIEQRLAQARRLAAGPFDDLTKERLRELVRSLEERLDDDPLRPRDR
jgi:hypothetical protein